MLAFLWAEDQRHLIGNQGHLPWHLPNDLHYFKSVTWQQTIVMGHRTFTSLPHGALPQRQNIVLSHDHNLHLPHVQMIYSKAELLQLAATSQKIFVIGGSNLFAQLRAEVDYLYVTKIAHQFAGDVYMPPLDYQDFQLIYRRQGEVNSQNPWPHEFLIYQRYK